MNIEGKLVRALGRNLRIKTPDYRKVRSYRATEDAAITVNGQTAAFGDLETIDGPCDVTIEGDIHNYHTVTITNATLFEDPEPSTAPIGELQHARSRGDGPARHSGVLGGKGPTERLQPGRETESPRTG